MSHPLTAAAVCLLLICGCSAAGETIPHRPEAGSAGAGGQPATMPPAPVLALYAPECGKAFAGVALWVEPVYFTSVGADVRLLVSSTKSGAVQTLAPIDPAGPDTSGDFGSVKLGAGVNTLDLQARDANGVVTRLAPADRCVVTVGQ